MSDLISRQAAIDALNKRAKETFTLAGWYSYYLGALHDVADDIKQIPSAQPEIIRCKDCKYSDDYYNDGSCYCKHPEREMWHIGTNWNWYCADGERKEEDIGRIVAILKDEFVETLRKAVEQSQPTVDTVPAVRCKECRKRPCYWKSVLNLGEDDFCSFGEREEL